MRELKFRAIKVNGDGWSYGYPIYADEYRGFEGEKPSNLYMAKGLNGDYVRTGLSGGVLSLDIQASRVDPETLGQFTGLKDKNGVDIYEGDIVKCNKKFWPENRGWTEILEVEPITCSQFDDEYGGGQDYVESVVSIEVVGNKYENPELLESK